MLAKRTVKLKFERMDKESRYELQLIDCNCNDCKFMERDLERFKKSLDDHHRWQLNHFNIIRNNLYKKAEDWKRRGFPEKYEIVKREADKLKFQFDKKEAMINYGKCLRFNKAVSFIPNTCQLETQECFEHRRTMAIII